LRASSSLASRDAFGLAAATTRSMNDDTVFTSPAIREAMS
jgi:hypothetical protein